MNSIFTFDFDNEDKIVIAIDDTLEKYDQYWMVPITLFLNSRKFILDVYDLHEYFRFV